MGSQTRSVFASLFFFSDFITTQTVSSPRAPISLILSSPRSRSTMNLNRSGLMKLSCSSTFSASMPATASNPYGFHSLRMKCCTSTAGLASSDFASPVLGARVPFSLLGEEGRGVNFVSKFFIIFAAFSTHDCISVRDCSRPARLDISFPDFLRSWNSLESVI